MGAYKRVRLTVNVIYCHLNIRFSTVPLTLRANVVALALVVKRLQARDSIPPI